MLELITGCRLHFGLVELAANQPHRYGGLGMMIQSPALHLRLRTGQPGAAQSGAMDQVGDQANAQTHGQSSIVAPDDEWQRRMALAEACVQSALAASTRDGQFTEMHELTGMTLEVVDAAPLHCGLGIGTQLAASVASLVELHTLGSCTLGQTALGQNALGQSVVGDTNWPLLSGPSRLAQLTGRGKRSAIGLHGFLYGGLVQDFGYGLEAQDGQVPSANRARLIRTRSTQVPSRWRLVLITSSCAGDMCGLQEEHLIDRAGVVPNAEREQMLQLSEGCMQAASVADFVQFTKLLEQYMMLAANLFAPVQAGRYRDRATAERVELLQGVGLRAVGQSSWGPTVFGFAESQLAAQQAADRLEPLLGDATARVVVTAPLNQGARWLAAASTGAKHAS